jgi:hypothetical protein
MSFEELLTSLPVGQWKTRQALAFDWYDGPRGGICALEVPEVEFAYDLLDERMNEDEGDDRLFRLSELPRGSVAEALSAISILGQPAGPLWVPVWRFPDHAARLKAEERLQRIEAHKRPTGIIVLTRDLLAFQGCWQVQPNGRNPTDWFAELQIGPRQPA